METSLHRDLKRLYAAPGAQLEARLGRYRIDVVNGRQLVEIQHGSLSALRSKLAELLDDHPVLVVKPIVARKLLIKQRSKDGPVVERRLSPKRGTMQDVFNDLVYFTRVFPHPNLHLELLLVEIEEWRYPGHGRRRRWRRSDHVVADQKLVSVVESRQLQTACDLIALLPCMLPRQFHSGQLATLLSIPRFFAQRITYCLRETGAVEPAGKAGNARLYRTVPRKPARRQRPAA